MNGTTRKKAINVSENNKPNQFKEGKPKKVNDGTRQYEGKEKVCYTLTLFGWLTIEYSLCLQIIITIIYPNIKSAECILQPFHRDSVIN